MEAGAPADAGAAAELPALELLDELAAGVELEPQALTTSALAVTTANMIARVVLV